MADLFSNLGINWKILAAQIVNFAVLLYILQRFLYRPLIKALNNRREEIQKAHEGAQTVEQRLKEIEAEHASVLDEARRKSTELIKKGEVDATKTAERILADAKADAARLSAEERVKLLRERDKLMQEASQKLGETVALAVEKSVGDVLDTHAKEKLVAQALGTVTTRN